MIRLDPSVWLETFNTFGERENVIVQSLIFQRRRCMSAESKTSDDAFKCIRHVCVALRHIWARGPHFEIGSTSVTLNSYSKTNGEKTQTSEDVL